MSEIPDSRKILKLYNQPELGSIPTSDFRPQTLISKYEYSSNKCTRHKQTSPDDRRRYDGLPQSFNRNQW